MCNLKLYEYMIPNKVGLNNKYRNYIVNIAPVYADVTSLEYLDR